MSHAVMVLGESGTGKSTSLRNLQPERVLLIQSIPKALPFRSKGWKPYNKQTKTGNVVVSDDAATIEKFMRHSPHEIVILDDFQYVLSNEYMRRSAERGFDKFADIGRNAWDILSAATQLAADRRVYILAHTATDDQGKTRMKTVGRMVDEKITPEGMVTISLRTHVVDGKYFFATQNNGQDTTKTPMGMFDDTYIDNDLALVDEAICNYYEIGATEEVAA